MFHCYLWFPGGRRISSQPKSILHAATPIAMAVGTQEPRLFWRGGMRSFNRCSCDPRHLMGSRAGRQFMGNFTIKYWDLADDHGFYDVIWFLQAKMACIPQCVVILIWREHLKTMINHEIQGAPILRNTPYRRVNPLDVTCQVGESVSVFCPDYPLCRLRRPCVFCSVMDAAYFRSCMIVDGCSKWSIVDELTIVKLLSTHMLTMLTRTILLNYHQ